MHGKHWLNVSKTRRRSSALMSHACQPSSARCGRFAGWSSPQGNDRGGDIEETRRARIAMDIVGSGADTELVFHGRYGAGTPDQATQAVRGLRNDLVLWEPDQRIWFGRELSCLLRGHRGGRAAQRARQLQRGRSRVRARRRDGLDRLPRADVERTRLVGELAAACVRVEPHQCPSA
jgi:hypothetical protein